MKNIVEFLSNISPLSEQNLALIASIFVSGELKKGDYFVREGVQENEIAFLERVVVRAFYTNKQGREYNKTLFTAPAIIGSYASLYDRQ